MDKSPAVDLLEEHYIDWMKKWGRRPLKEFAIYLDIAEGTLNRMINGKQPITSYMLVHLARKLKDPRFYAFEDLPEPDPDFEKLAKIWQYIPEDLRRELREQGEGYVAENREE